MTIRTLKVSAGAIAAIACGLAVALTPGAGTAGTGASRAPAAAISAAVGAAGRSFWVRDLRAQNTPQHLQASFSPGGVQIRKGARSTSLSLMSFGRAGRLTDVRPSAPVAHLNRVSYDYGSVSEWYVNGPLGLEQGFEVARAPAGVGPVVLSMSLGGDMAPRMSAGSVLLGGQGGLRYGGLAVRDASGRALRSSLGLSGSWLQISIDATGARYPLHVDPAIQEAELSPPSGSGPTQFGTSVAVSGNTIVVGDPRYDNSGDDEQVGAVFVFEQHAGSWDTTPDAVLRASDLSASAQLGISVAISGNTIVAGAKGQDSSPGEGSAYVFVEPSSGWTSTSTPSAELNTNVGEAGDTIGASVAISGNTVVAGAPGFGNVGGSGGNGAAFVWVEPSTGWVSTHNQTAALVASDGASSDQFGASVGISGDAIVVGAPDHTVPNGGGAFSQGTAYAFDEPAGGWANMAQTAELTASDGATDDRAGNSVAIAGDTVAVGAPDHTNANGSGYTHQGVVYLYGLPATGTVQQTSTVTAPGSGGNGNALGNAIGLAGTTLVANEIGNSDGYEFPGLAGQSNQLIPSDAGTKGYTVPAAIAVDGATAVLGDYNPYVSSPPGNAYVYPSGGSAAAPAVVTGAASAVSVASAAVSATVTAGGTDTNYVFRYGTSATSLSSTLPAIGEFGAGSGGTPIAQHAQPLTGLSQNTTYYYEACATNVATGSTPVCGSVQSFKTGGTSSQPLHPRASAGKASVSGTTVSVPISCTGSGTCDVTITLSVTETVQGGKLLGVSASAKHKKPKKTKKTVTVGRESIKLAAGSHKTVKVSLNGAGKRLLKKHPKLSVRLLVTSGGKKVKSSTVTFKAKKAKHKK